MNHIRLCLIALLFLSHSAFGAVIYNNLDPVNGTYALTAGQGVAGSATSFGRELSIAVSFTLSADANLGTIEVALEQVPVSRGTPPDLMEVSVWSDHAGLPGTLVDGLGSASGFPVSRSSNSILQTYMSTAMPLLLANTQYWVKVSAATPDAWAVWRRNTERVIGDAYFDGSAGVWQFRPNTVAGAMRISSVDAVLVLPGSLSLFLLGGLLLGWSTMGGSSYP